MKKNLEVTYVLNTTGAVSLSENRNEQNHADV